MDDAWKPKNDPAVSIYLVLDDPEAELAFVTSVLDAKVGLRLDRPDGGLAHAEFIVQGVKLMMSQASDRHRPAPAMLVVYVPDTDATYAAALAVGATSEQPPTDTFYGCRVATVRTANGVQWALHTLTEPLTDGQLKERMHGAAGPS